MQRLDVLEYYKIRFYELFYTTKDQTMIYEIGLVTVIGLVLTPLVYKKLRKYVQKNIHNILNIWHNTYNNDTNNIPIWKITKYVNNATIYI